MKLFILILSFLFAVPALASEAEETILLGTPAAVSFGCPTVRIVRTTIRKTGTDSGKFAVHCYAGNKFIPGTVTWFRIGVPLSDGSLGTLVEGHIIKYGTPENGASYLGDHPKLANTGQCSVTAPNALSYVRSSGAEGAHDSDARGMKDVVRLCVGYKLPE